MPGGEDYGLEAVGLAEGLTGVLEGVESAGGGGGAVMPVGDVEDRNVAEGLGESLVVFGRNAPARVLDAVVGGEREEGGICRGLGDKVG